MEVTYIFYIAGLIISACIAAWVSWHTWNQRKTSHTPAFIAVMLAVTYWLSVSVVDILVQDPFTKILLNKLGYIGVLTLPVAWFAFSMQYAGKGSLLTPFRIVLLLIFPTFMEILILNGALWSNVQFIEKGPFLHIYVTLTPWVWPQATYGYSLILIGSYIMTRAVIGLPKVYRYQAIALVTGVLIPLAVNVVYLFGLLPINEYDLTPISFAFSGLAISWGLFHYKLFTLLPIARDILIEDMPVGFIVLNDTFKIVDLNPAAQAIIAGSRSTVLGKPVAQVFPPAAEWVERMRSDDVSPMELMMGSGQQTRIYEIRAAKINQGKGDILGYLIVLQDITLRVFAEQDLKAALTFEKELYELRSRLVTNTSHEFRTPLSIIFSSAELLEYYGSQWTVSKRLEHIQRIKSAVNHMTRMVDEILVVGRVDANKVVLRPVTIDVVSFCKTLLEEMRFKDQEKHTFLFECTVPECITHIDELLLRQIVSNLLDNAAKYSPEDSYIRLCLSRADEQWTLEFIDEGMGIPDADLPHIGEPFYRGENVAHVNGTGLGLTIVDKSLSLIGGKIEFNSVVNQGTRATITVPIVNSEPLPK